MRISQRHVYLVQTGVCPSKSTVDTGHLTHPLDSLTVAVLKRVAKQTSGMHCGNRRSQNMHTELADLIVTTAKGFVQMEARVSAVESTFRS